MTGGQQIESINFFQAYAPAVQQIIIYLILILEVLLKLKSKQGDITASFPYATLEERENTSMKMP